MPLTATANAYNLGMRRGDQIRKRALHRYVIFKMKLIELLHLHLVWKALNDDLFTPPNVMGHDGTDFADTLRTVLLSWYMTLVDKNGLDVFPLWLELFPKHRKRIENLRNETDPQLNILREFRDRVGFHGDTPGKYFNARKKLKMSHADISAALQKFLDLAVFLAKREEKELSDFVPEAESLFLDLELEFGLKIKRQWMKKNLVLPSKSSYRVTF